MAKGKILQDDTTVESVADGAKKKDCPITKAQFEEGAEPLVIDIDGEKKVLSPKVFKTGSFGWHTNEKITVMVGETPVRVQLNCNCTVIGSKDLPE